MKDYLTANQIKEIINENNHDMNATMNELISIDDDYSWLNPEMQFLPEGWASCFGAGLIHDVNYIIYNHYDEEQRESFSVAQIKEKFGELCFYADGMNAYMSTLVNIYENMSQIVCIECGSMNDVTILTKGWIQPLCEQCLIKNNKAKYINPVSSRIHDVKADLFTYVKMDDAKHNYLDDLMKNPDNNMLTIHAYVKKLHETYNC